ncbi:MAG: TRAM domain-containing protein, partial [Boseongicola sp.]
HQQRATQEAMVGKEVEVLFEKPGRIAGQLMGKSEHLHAVNVATDKAAIGEVARVAIEKSNSNSLAGTVVSKSY